MSQHPDPDQYMPALARAQEIRLHRCKVRRELRAGSTTLAAALADPMLSTMPVGELLCAQYRWSEGRAIKALAACDIRVGMVAATHKQVGTLTERQREALVAYVEQRPAAA